jgi:hypothetical protein
MGLYALEAAIPLAELIWRLSHFAKCTGRVEHNSLTSLSADKQFDDRTQNAWVYLAVLNERRIEE